MASKKILGADNPALAFISSIGVEAEPSQPTAVPEGYRENPQYIEKRTKRMQLVVQPSLYEKVTRAAKAQGQSTNDFIHKLLEEAVKE